MSEWNSSQYLKFSDERTQPAIDLVNRIAIDAPERVLDVGCGPGNSTNILKSRYPMARVLGIDNSPGMIDKARTLTPDIEFMVCDAATQLDSLGGGFDIVFSNACLQWIPDHRKLLPKLFSLVKSGGVLAVQIPKNGESPLYKVMDEVISQPGWSFNLADIDYNLTLPQDEYFDILASMTADFSIWETTYYHRMDSHRSLVEWIKGTKLRPYLNALDDEGKVRLEDEIVDRVKDKYDIRENGQIIYKFLRLFYIARKG